jgi:periplasmic mercuric ion binding protein
MKGKITNIVLVIAAILLLAVFAFAVRTKPAADHVAVLKTTGMTCGGCSTSIEKALLSARGVAAVEVDVAAGRVVVAYDSKAVRPEALAATVSGLGFGSSILQNLTGEQYQAATGRNAAQIARPAGCGCCDKNRN